MSTDHNAFLAAIIADPASDTLRLIYADWLEEQGDADQHRRPAGHHRSPEGGMGRHRLVGVALDVPRNDGLVLVQLL